MQTQILPALKETIAGAEADTILRQCVHCGMCNALVRLINYSAMSSMVRVGVFI